MQRNRSSQLAVNVEPCGILYNYKGYHSVTTTAYLLQRNYSVHTYVPGTLQSVPELLTPMSSPLLRGEKERAHPRAHCT